MFKSISISDKKIALILHGIAWIIVIILPLFLNSAFGGDDPHRLYQFYVHTFSAVLIFYLGYLWLVPRFFLQDKKSNISHYLDWNNPCHLWNNELC
jgi:uncharacterized protein YqhQ